MKIAKANAFRKVPGLKRIVIPEGVVAIEPSTFFNCRELEEDESALWVKESRRGSLLQVL